MSFTSVDPGGTFIALAVVVGVVLVVAGLAVWIARRRGSRTVVLDAALAIAQVWIFLAVIGIGFVVWRLVTGSALTIVGLPLSTDSLLPSVDGVDTAGGEPALIGGSISTADIEAVGLPLGIRLILGATEILRILLFIVPAVIVASLCRRTLAGDPFSRHTMRWTIGGAVFLLVAGTAQELLQQLGSFLAAGELLPSHGSAAAVTAPAALTLTVPLWPLGAALALGAVAAVFGRGATLQKETDGLV